MLFLLFTSSCNEKTEFHFLYVGHAYDWSNYKGNTVDVRLENLEIDYDGYWLGGDVCGSTSLNPNTFEYLDDLFDLSDTMSHFVLGNHDVRDNNADYLSLVTKRPDFYTSTFENLVVSVLNTNLNSSDCFKLDAQFRMLSNVCDTITSSSHYLLLMHHQVFGEIDGLENFKSNGICSHYAMNCDSNDSSFEKTIYPKLVALENRGIEVVVVVGDTGWHKGCEVESKGGVTFLASGINNSHYSGKEINFDLKSDRVLLFALDTRNQKLTWQFRKLNDLSSVTSESWWHEQ